MRKNWKKRLTGLLCALLLFTDLIPANITFAAETETAQAVETDFMQEKENTDTSEYETQEIVEETPAEVKTQEQETETRQETNSKESVIESTITGETTEEKSSTQESETLDADTAEIKSEAGTETETITEEEIEIEAETETETEAKTEIEEATETEIETVQSAADTQTLFAADDIASGTINESYGHIAWVIDKDGKLTVTGTGDIFDYSLNYWNEPLPWHNYRTSIKSAKLKWSDATSANNIFSGCSNLTSVDLSEFNTSKVIKMSSMFADCSSLTNIDLSGFDTSKVTTMYRMFDGCRSLTSLELGSLDTRNVVSMYCMFADCSSLTSLNLSNFDTSNVTDMFRMFYKCSNLTDLELDHFDTGKVVKMNDMFYECTKLTSLDLSSFDTHNVTDMREMFRNCKNLVTLNLDGFDTHNITSTYLMFYECNSLTGLDLGSFDTSSVTDMHSMFCNCNSLTSLNLSSFDTRNVTNMGSIFSGCQNLTNLNLDSFDTRNVTNMGMMFGGCQNLTNLNLDSFDTRNVTNMGSIFSGCQNLTNLNLDSFDTRNVTSMNSMFMDCSSLTELDLSSFNTGNVTNMGQMFTDCSSLTKLNLSSFNTAKVTSMRVMFLHCGNLTDLELEKFNTMKLTSAEGMFSNCTSLTSLNLSNFDTRNITDMSGMFNGCTSLTSLDLSNFNTANVTDMSSMFGGCSGLKNINLGSFDTGNVTDMRWMFGGCSSLTSLNLSNFDAHNIIQYDPNNSRYTRGTDCMFTNCSGLEYIEFPQNTAFIGLDAFRGCTSLSSITIPDSVEYIYEQAFYECDNLTSVTFSNSVLCIYDKAFYQCRNLNSIELPDSVAYIGISTFAGCSSLSHIELPNNAADIDDRAFSRCAISSIVIPDGMAYIGNGMFRNCGNLSSVEFSGSVDYIGDYAFNGCGSLKSIELPNGVTGIGQYAFGGSYGSDNLRSIELPVSLTSISDYAFAECHDLYDVYYGGYEDNWKAISIGSGNENLTNAKIHYASTDPQTVSGVLRSGDGWKINWECTYKPGGNGPRNGRLEISVSGYDTEEELYLYNETGASEFPWELAPYNIPKSAISTLVIRGNPTKKLHITTNSFKGYSNLYSVVLEYVSGIDSAAFEDCKALHGVYCRDDEKALRVIDNGAFKNCTNLMDMTFPVTLERIGAEAFLNTSLKTIHLYDNINEIGTDAFTGCKNLLIYCEEGSYAHQYAQANNLPFRLSQAGVTITRIQKKEIPFYGWYSNKQLKMEWGWDLILKGDSDNYDNRLSKIALALSAAAENSESAVKGLMSELGVTSAVSTLGFPQMTMGYKTITDANGEKTYVFIIVCRGTDNAGDGIADGLSSIGVYDWGASALQNSLNKYIKQCASENNTVINRNNIKIFMTGHSLGGAATNIVAEGLNSDYGSENVFAYTFAAPSPLRIKLVSSGRNIHNIICLQDNVPLHLSTRINWCGYGRAGKFSVENSTEIESNYRELTQKSLKNTWDEQFFLRLHAVDVYMAYLLTNPRPYTPFYSHGGGAWCPVDLKIYNSAGELVGSITDNHVDEENRTMDVMLTVGGENNDEKYFYFLKDDTYTIELTGTDTGTMKYAAQYMNMNTDAVMTEKVFTNVALSKGKKLTSSASAWDKADATVDTDDKIDTSEVQLFVVNDNDEPEKEVLPDGNGTEVPVGGKPDEPNTNDDGVLKEDIPADGKIPEGLWIAGIKDCVYTATAIKPEVRVYDNDKRLKVGRDYTIAYKNNVKANDASNTKKAPTVIVKGKGNYSGTETATFKILPVDLNDSSIMTEDIYEAYTGKVQKKIPTLSYHNKKLAKNKDFTVSYPAAASDAYKAAGTYDILLTAKEGGNFTGTRTVKFTITNSILISKASVGKIPNQTYTGIAIEPELKVAYKKTPLIKGKDYTAVYTNHTAIGTATIAITGMGDYAGTKKITFKITGTPLNKASVTGIENKIYNGTGQKQSLKVVLENRTLTEGTDYETFYANNINAGKATITIKGINAYAGSIKKTFQIAPYDMNLDTEKLFDGLDTEITEKYVKGGCKPTPELTFAKEILIEDRDYTVSCKNNKAAATAQSKKAPVIIIKGKGNFKGTISQSFTITSKALDDAKFPVKLTVVNKGFVNKAGGYMSAPVLTDVNGKLLVMGTDYEKEIVYTLEDGTALTNKSLVETGQKIKVTVTGKGAYSGKLEGVYQITPNDFNKAKIHISPQIYTGKEITLNKEDITVKVGNDTLVFGTDYEIMEGSYEDNVKKGKAKVTIVGKGSYGGAKTVQFNIAAKKLAWFWRLLGKQ